MIRKCLRIGAGLLFSAAFVFPASAQAPLADRSVLTRSHSPTFGDPAAKVEIVEFFDPACEACRSMYPHVKKLLEEHRGRVRLTLRYVPFHRGSDDIIRLLEAARRQGKYPETLEILLFTQPRWTVKHVVRLDLALQAIQGEGIDMVRLKADMAAPEFTRLIDQDMEDASSLRVTRTPEFFVNRRPLARLGSEELGALVVEELRRSYGPAARK
jgi:protein-disulfide isomerase